MRRMAVVKAVIGIVLLGCFLAFTPVATAAQEKIPVVYIGPLTGPAAPWGLALSRGGKYHLDQANARGGVKVGGKTYTLDFIGYDHGNDPAKAIEYAKRAIFTDKARLLILQNTVAILPVLPIATENKILNFHYDVGRKTMNPDFLYSFRGSNDMLYGEAATYEYGRKNNGAKTVLALLPDDDGGWDMFGTVKEAAEMTGLKVLGGEYYIRGTKDFYPILSRALAKKPDLVTVGASPPGDVYLMIKQLYELGYKGVIEASSSIQADELKKMVPQEGLNNVLLYQLGTPDVPGYPTPEELAMKKAMIEKYGRNGKLFDTVIEGMWGDGRWGEIYVQALQKANSFDVEKLTKVIESSTFSVLGRQTSFGGKKVYGTKRQIVSDMPVLKIVDGAVKAVGVYKVAE